MYRSGSCTVLSPSDLVAHLGCGHATERERRLLSGELGPPAQRDLDVGLLRHRGDGHARDELARFRAAGLSVAEVTTTGSSPEELAAAEAETLALMQAGLDVVFGATFFDGRWRAQADFLLKVEVPSRLGPWAYDVADATLARRVEPAALVQLCAQAELVARLQGTWPGQLVVITRDGEHHRHRTSDVVSYFRMAKARFESAMDGPIEHVEAVPVAHCEVCAWSPECEEAWRATDHLSLIAGVRTDVLAKLASAGVTTGTLLGGLAEGEPVAGLPPHLVDRLRRQARLQLAQRADGVVRHELLLPACEPPGPESPVPEPVPGGSAHGAPARRAPGGLAALPAPSPGDLFFDIEGDPLVGEHGIEYLFGVVEAPAGGGAPPPYTGFWGHDEAGEKAAFESLVDLVVARLDRHPEMHVYHYAPYERRVLARLAARYDTRQVEVDRILSGRVLVDLYQVVRHSVLVSQDGYGLKKLEPLYLAPRTGHAVTDGGSSIVVYEAWRETGDAELLEDLRAYNEADCRSTLGLRDWLEARRDELAVRTGAPVPRPAAIHLADHGVVTETEEPGVSAVGHVLGGAATMAPEQGLSLDRSLRMHPDICRFLSSLSYEGRLAPAGREGRLPAEVSVAARSPAADGPAAERSVVRGLHSWAPVGPGPVAPGPVAPTLAGAGLRWVPVEHTGNRTRAPEEVEVVAALVADLLGREVADASGATTVVRPRDVLVMAPSDLQVAALHDALPPGVRVGSVDRVQGRHAPVVAYSLTSSSSAEMATGTDFSLATRRLRVAVSRAEAMVVVVGSPALLRAPVRTPAHLRHVNALCRFVEQAVEVRVPGAAR